MPKIKRILFPTDFSPNAKAAQAHVQSLAEDLKAEVHVLFVAEGLSLEAPDSTSLFVTPADSLEQVCRSAMPYLHKLFDSEWSQQHHVVHATRIGRPFREIIKYADENQIDLIIAGTHGHTGPLRILLGSVAENLVRHANCPVMTVRPPA